MIAAALRVEIERHAASMRRSNALLRRAAAGTLGPEHVARYVASLRHLIRHTPVHLARAQRRCEELGQPMLARHFATKLGEEVGHDAWADRDLERLTALRRAPQAAESAPAMQALVDYVGSLIDEEPAQYLAYTLAAEYVTVLIGPEWIDLLESRCGIPRGAMTVVGNHAELDGIHAEQAFDDVDDMVADPRALPRLRQVVQTSLGLFDAFCAEAVALGDHEVAARRAHAPAA